MAQSRQTRVEKKDTGQKQEVMYDPLEQLEKGQATLFEQPEGSYKLPEVIICPMVAEFNVMAVKGAMDVGRPDLRNNAFPVVQPTHYSGGADPQGMESHEQWAPRHWTRAKGLCESGDGLVEPPSIKKRFDEACDDLTMHVPRHQAKTGSTN